MLIFIDFASLNYTICVRKFGLLHLYLQTSLLLFKCTNHSNKIPFVSTANETLVGTLITIGDVNDIFAIEFLKELFFPSL